MNKLSELWRRARRHKYIVVVLLFAVVIFFIDDYNLIRRYNYQCEIVDLKKEIESCNKEVERITGRIAELENDSGGMERTAREYYRMHTDDEEIFIFEN